MMWAFVHTGVLKGYTNVPINSNGLFLNDSFILNESLMWLRKNESSLGVIRSVEHVQHPIGSALD